MNCSKMIVLLYIFIVMISQIDSGYSMIQKNPKLKSHTWIRFKSKMVNKIQLKQSEDVELDESDNSSFALTDYKLNSESRPNTSCGDITCDHIANYPYEEVEKIYEKFYKDKTLQNKTTHYHLSTNTDETLFKKKNSHLKSKQRGVDRFCKKYENNIQVKYPQEGIDENNNPQIICNLQPGTNFGLIAKICTNLNYTSQVEGKYCHCTIRTKSVETCTYNNATKRGEIKTIRIEDGCTCRNTRK